MKAKILIVLAVLATLLVLTMGCSEGAGEEAAPTICRENLWRELPKRTCFWNSPHETRFLVDVP
jgi:hypothetical protein